MRQRRDNNDWRHTDEHGINPDELDGQGSTLPALSMISMRKTVFDSVN